MGLIVPPTIAGKYQTNLTVSSRNGTNVTAGGTAHTKGSYVSLIDPISLPSFGIFIRAAGLSTAAAVTNFLLDLACAPSGGGSEQIIIPDLQIGAASGDARMFFFPVYFAAGSALRARGQATIASDVATIAVWLGQVPLYPFNCGRVTAYGVVPASSNGTSVTPGSGAFGSWTQLTSATSRPHKYWAASYCQLSDTTIATVQMILELGTGPDASNVTTIYSSGVLQNTSEQIYGPFPFLQYAPVPSGVPIWARIASGETEARGVIAYGMD